MEDQPSFFFNQAEHDTDEGQEESSDLTKKKKKQGKLTSVRDKLFEFKEEKQPETEQKSFFKAFESLFSKFTGVEKEDIQDVEAGSQEDKLPSMKMPFLNSVELTSVNNIVEDEEAPTKVKHGEYEESLLNIKHDIEKDLIDTEDTNTIIGKIINDNEIQKDDSSDFPNESFNDANYSQVIEGENTDTVNVDPKNNDNWQNNEDFDYLNNINTVYTETEKLGAKNIDTTQEINPSDNIEPSTGGSKAALAGDVAAEKLYKSNNKRLRSEVKKINNELSKKRKKEKLDREDIKNLYKVNRYQKQENNRLTDRLNTQEDTQAAIESDLRKFRDNNKKFENQKENIKNESNDKLNSHQNYTKHNRDAPLLENKNISKKGSQIKHDQYKNSHITEKQPKRSYQPIDYERFNESENNKNEQKQIGNYEKITDAMYKHSNKVENSHQIKTLPQQVKATERVDIKNNQVDAKNHTQNRYIKPEKYYKEAIQQGFTAGIIVLVSLGLIVLVWSLIN